MGGDAGGFSGNQRTRNQIIRKSGLGRHHDEQLRDIGGQQLRLVLVRAIQQRAARIEKDFAWAVDHPVVDAYRTYMKMPYDRPTWDLTAVLYAVRPDVNYFSLSPPGTITVQPDGSSHFEPSANGNHRYLIIKEEQRARTLEAMILLASEPPADSARH